MERFDQHGELSEQDFEDFGIRGDDHQRPNGKQRDQRVIYQRRSLIMTHPVLCNKEYPDALVSPNPPPAKDPTPIEVDNSSEINKTVLPMKRKRKASNISN